MERLQAAEKEAAVAGARVASLEELEKVLRQERASTSTLRQEVHRSQAEVEELRAKNGELRKALKQLGDE